MNRILWDVPDIGEEECSAVYEALRNNYIGANGPNVEALEQAVCQKFDVKYAIAVCNGTMALVASLLAIKEHYHSYENK